MYGLKSLSEVFGGKARGLPSLEINTNMPNTNEMGVSSPVKLSEKDWLKEKTNLNLKIKGQDIESKIFGSMKGKSSAFESENMMRSTKFNKFESVAFGKTKTKIEGLGTKSFSESKIWGKLGGKGLKKDFFSRNLSGTGLLAKGRVARGTSTEDLTGGTGGTGFEDAQTYSYSFEASPQDIATAATNKRDELLQPNEKEAGILQKAGKYGKDFLSGLGVIETPEKKQRRLERYEQQRKLENEAFKQAMEDIQTEKAERVKQRVRLETRDELLRRRGYNIPRRRGSIPASGFDELQERYGGIYGDPEFAEGAWGGFRAAIPGRAETNMQTVKRWFEVPGGRPGTLVYASKMSPGQSDFMGKVINLVGSKEQREAYASQSGMIQGIPMSSQMPVQEYQPTPTQGGVYQPNIPPSTRVAQASGTVLSPYSKKPVTYIRGPYRKTQYRQQYQQ